MKEMECKFCHKPVLFEPVTCRVYELDRETLHVKACERRKAFYHNHALVVAERKRQNRSGER